LLTIDFLLTSVSLSYGDDARPVIARRMGYDDQAPSQPTQGDEPFLAVRKTIVFEGDAWSGEYLLGILKTEAMLGDVRPVLRLVLFVFHSISRLIVLLFVVTHNARKCAAPRAPTEAPFQLGWEKRPASLEADTCI
jgi:hypothetical protein